MPDWREPGTNLVLRELGDFPQAEVEGGRGRDGPAVRRVPRRAPGGQRKGGSWGGGRRAVRGAGRKGGGGEERLGHGRGGQRAGLRSLTRLSSAARLCSGAEPSVLCFGSCSVLHGPQLLGTECAPTADLHIMMCTNLLLLETGFIKIQ